MIRHQEGSSEGCGEELRNWGKRGDERGREGKRGEESGREGK